MIFMEDLVGRSLLGLSLENEVINLIYELAVEIKHRYRIIYHLGNTFRPSNSPNLLFPFIPHNFFPLFPAVPFFHQYQTLINTR